MGWKKRFIATTHKMEPNEKIAVLTRATIRLNRLKVFWKHVDAVNKEMLASDGYIMSYGIGNGHWYGRLLLVSGNRRKR